MSKKKVLVPTAVLASSFLFASLAGAAELPSNSLILGEKGYSVQLLDNAAITPELQGAAANANGVLVWNTPANELRSIVDLSLVDKGVIPNKITYKNAAGEESEIIIDEQQGELKVESVSAINAKKIKVVFSNAMDEDTAEDVTKYSINGAALASGTDVATLSEDKKSVTLELNTALTNDNAVTVKIDKGIRDAQGNVLSKTDDYSTGFFFSDHVKPVATAVKSVNGNIEITFSEELDATVPTVIVNGKTVTANAPVENKVIVTKANLASANLENGKSYAIVVSGAKDLANNTMNLYQTNVTYVVVTDTTAPKVNNVIVDGESKIKVAFSEEVAVTAKDGATDVATEIGLSVKKSGVAIAGATATTKDGINFVIDLSATAANAVFDGAKNETRVSLDLEFNGYKDLANNLGANVAKTVTLNKDTVAPTITKVEYDAANTNIILTFSEELDAVVGTAIDSALTIVNDKTGKVVTPAGPAATAVTAGDKKVTISNAAGALNLSAGSYTFYFAEDAFTDLALNGGNDSKELSLTVTITGDTDTKPEVTSATENGLDTIDVLFDTAVKGGKGEGSATDVSNYKLNGKDLPKGTLITLDGAGTTATIKMPAESIETTHTGILTVSGVQSVDGAVIDTVDVTVSLTDSKEPVLLTANYDVNNDTILLTFSEDVTGVVAGDFVVTVNDVTVADAAIATPLAGDKASQVRIESAGTSFATGEVVISTISTTPTGADAAANTLKKKVSVNLKR